MYILFMIKARIRWCTCTRPIMGTIFLVVLKDHVLNRLSPRKSHAVESRPKFHSKITSIFKKSAIFKGLKSSPRMY